MKPVVALLPVHQNVSGDFHEVGKDDILVGVGVALIDQEDLHEALDDAASVQLAVLAYFVPYVYTLAHCEGKKESRKRYCRGLKDLSVV